MDRHLRDTRIVRKFTLYNEAGVATDATEAVTVEVRDGAGAHMTGSPFTAADVAGTGEYELVLSPAVTTQMDFYDEVWNYTVDGAAQKVRRRFEIVGRFLFEISELRAHDSKLADTTKYPDLKIKEAREYAEETFERHCWPSFRPRAKRLTVSGNGVAQLLLPDPYLIRLVSGSISTVALTADDISDLWYREFGALERKTRGYWTAGDANVVLFYEYGMVEPPEPVRREAIVLAVSRLIPSAIPVVADSFSSDGENVRMSIPERRGPTGIPSVDAVIAEYPAPPVFV